MQVRVFTLRFDPLTEGFDETSLHDFVRDKAVHAVTHHFFEHEGQPYLTFVVTYRLPAPSAPRSAAGETGEAPTRRQREATWRKLLRAEDYPLFNALRDWRAERARQEGVPPYVICTNKQLAQAVRARPSSLSQLGEIEGIGPIKLKKYGGALLRALGTAAPAAAPEASPPEVPQPETSQPETLHASG